MSGDISKIKARIGKLLRMADGTHSPNEAAIAARRARALMDEYQLENIEEILSDWQTGPKVVKHRNRRVYKTRGGWRGNLAIAAAELNDCGAAWQVDRYDDGLRQVSMIFAGLANDAEMADWTFEFFQHQLQYAAHAYLMAAPTLSRRDMTSYRVGYTEGVLTAVRKVLLERRTYMASTGTDLVVLKQEMIKQDAGERFVKHGYRRRVTPSEEFEHNRVGFEHGKRVRMRRELAGGDSGN